MAAIAVAYPYIMATTIVLPVAAPIALRTARAAGGDGHTVRIPRVFRRGRF